jgi:metallophosphoesterase
LRVGFIGDIVGRVGRNAVSNNLKYFINKFELDFVVANAENASGGFGLTSTNAIELFESGIDVITGGNHSFDKKDSIELMSKMPIIRPYNHFAGVFGKGVANITKNGKSISVINLMGNYSMPHCNNAFLEVESALKECVSDNILIDFHAEATSEKNAFFHHLCGRITAIFGTHTHVGTDDLQILNSTAYVSDVGLSGAFDGVIGMDKEAPIKAFLTGLKHSFKVNEKARTIFQMIVFECEDGKCVDAFKIRLIDSIDEVQIQRALHF